MGSGCSSLAYSESGNIWEFMFTWCCRSVYHAVTDVAILRFMVEVCWGPMLAAFSVTLDQSDDRLATSQCLQGFRHAIHVTSLMGMQTQRDAFVTSVAKFTYLHNAADMKQKNVDAVKVCACSVYLIKRELVFARKEHLSMHLCTVMMEQVGSICISDFFFLTLVV